MEKGYSVKPGYMNPKGQIVVRKTDRKGTDHGQSVYQMACSDCGNVYRANGSDTHLRKCPSCQDGMPGLEFQ